MKSKLNIFLKILEGSWISQKTTYYLKINQICSNQFKYLIYDNKYSIYNDNNEYYLQYYKNYIKEADTYKFNQANSNNSGTIKKKKNSDNYQYSIHKDKCLKIQYIAKNIKYTEYINAINEKFIMSIAFLKKSNKYIAISFSSNIKIKEIDFK